MRLDQKLVRVNSVFIDTAPIIYHIEAHPQYGELAKGIFDLLLSGKLHGYSSVITIAEVLPKPVELGNEKLARWFINFLTNGPNLTMIDINDQIAISAGKMRGRYTWLRALDALQIATAMDVGADLFITNDSALKKVRDLKVLVLKDFLDH